MKTTGKYLALLAVILGAFWSLPSGMRAQSRNQAALVVRLGDNLIETACVEFEEPQISGFDLIQRSGFDIEIEAQGLGALVCRINDTGCPASDCWCQCSGGNECIYWSYWHQLQEGWQYSQAGSTVYQVEPGAVEGWSWGPGAVNLAVPPPDISFEEVCQSPVTDTPSPSPTATNTTAAIIVTPLATPMPSLEAVDTAVPGVPTATGTSTATNQPTVTMTVSVSETPRPLRQETATSLSEIAPTLGQESQPILEETESPPSQAESDEPAKVEEEQPTFTPAVIALAVTNKPVSVAAIQMADNDSETLPSVESDRVIVEATSEPVKQFTVIGSGVVPMTENVDGQSHSLDQEEVGMALPDWLTYAIFLIIMGGLGTILFILSLRRKSKGMQ